MKKSDKKAKIIFLSLGVVTIFLVTFFVSSGLVLAQTSTFWIGPTQSPPAGNISGLILNKPVTDATGQDASINIIGDAKVHALGATSVCIGTPPYNPADCKSSWDTGGGAFWQQAASGSGIYYNGGNVNIGNNSPVKIDWVQLLIDMSNTTEGLHIQRSAVGASSYLKIEDKSGGTTKPIFTVHENSNVGIGTATPRTKQEISFASGGLLPNINWVGQTVYRSDAQSDAWGAGLAVLAYQNKGLIIGGGGYGGSLYTYNGTNAPTERIRIDSVTGNVGIGTTAPTRKLMVSSSEHYDGILATDGTRWTTIMPGTVINHDFNGIVQPNDNAIIYSGGSIGTGGFVIAPWANGTSGIRMDSAGNVGIGSSAPKVALDITADDDNSTVTNKKSLIVLRNYNTGQNAISEISMRNAQSGTDGWNNSMRIGISGVNFVPQGGDQGLWVNNMGYLVAGVGAVNGLSVGATAPNGDIRFFAGGFDTPQQRMIIRSTGNVGIGTLTPTKKLDVAGDIQASGAICAGAVCLGSGGSDAWTKNGTNTYNTPLTNNVGIGTQTPGAKLDVAGYNRLGAGIADSWFPYTNNWAYVSGAGIIFRKDNAGGLAETMRIDQNGNVGIGTTAPSEDLTIQRGSGNAGIIALAGGPDGYQYSGVDLWDTGTNNVGNSLWRITQRQTNAAAGQTDHSFMIHYKDSSGNWTNPFTILPNGNVGIGTSNPNNLLQVKDLIYFDNTNTAIGRNTLQVNTGPGNTALGSSALLKNTTGMRNTAAGAGALYSNTTGKDNTAVGGSLYDNTTGSYNTAAGMFALYNNTVGNNNAAFGNYALFKSTWGSNNTAYGVDALYNNSSGSNNVAIGNNAGSYELGSNAFYVDNQDRGSTAGDKANALMYGIFAASPASQWLTINADVAVMGKHAIRGTDSWLRLNQDGAFTSGVHTPGVFAPGSLNVGGAGGWGNPGSGNVWVTGSVGIGNSAPATALDVSNSTGQSYINVGAPAGKVAGIRWSEGNTPIWYFYKANDSSNDLRLNNGASDFLTVKNSTGFVGIGTNSPANKLDVANGNVGISSNGVTLLNMKGTQSGINFKNLDGTLNGSISANNSTDLNIGAGYIGGVLGTISLVGNVSMLNNYVNIRAIQFSDPGNTMPSTACTAANEGATYYRKDIHHFMGCNGTVWKQLDN